MPDFNQIAFSGGEISETAYGRADIEKYQVGLAESLNVIPQVQGSAINRGGFEFVDETITDTGTVRLIKFQYNNDDAYVLEFTENRIRFFKTDSDRKSLSDAGGYVTKEFNFTGNPGGVGSTTTIEASDLEANNGDEIEFTIIPVGMNDWYENGHGPKKHRYSLKNRTDVIENAISIDITTVATKAVVTSTGHPFSNGEHVYMSGLLDENGNAWTSCVNSGGIPLFQVLNSNPNDFELGELDGTNVDPSAASWTGIHSGDPTAGTPADSGSARLRTFDLGDKLGANVNSTGWGSFTWASNNEADWIYTVPTTYADAELKNLSFVQTANIMTITHRDYPVKELTRTSDTSWTLADANFDVTMASPSALTGYPNSRCDSKYYRDNSQDSLYQEIRGYVVGSDGVNPGFIHNITAHASEPLVYVRRNGATGADQPHNLVVGDFIILRGMTGGAGEWEDLNGTPAKVTIVPTATSFNIKRPDGSAIDTTAFTNLYNVEHTDANFRDYGWCEMRAYTNTNPAVVSITVYDLESGTDNGPLLHLMSKPPSIKNDEKVVFSGLQTLQTSSPFGLTYSGLNEDNIVLRNRSNVIPAGSGGSGWVMSDGLVHYEMYYTTGVAVDTSAAGNGNMGVGGNKDTAWFGVNFMRYAVTAVSKRTGEESFPTRFEDNSSTDYDALASDDPSETRPFTLGWTAPTGGDVDYYNVYRWQNGVYGFIGIVDPAGLFGNTPFFQDINFSPELGDNPPEDPVRNPFQKKITGVSTTTSIVTSADHEWDIGDRVLIADITPSNHQLNGITAYISPNDYTADQYKLRLTLTGNDLDMSGYATYTSGGYAADWPGAVGYHSQRRGFASQFNKRQTVHWSATGLDSVFSSQENAFSYTVTESGANEIRHIITGRSPFLFTSGSVIDSSSGDAGFALENVVNREQTNDGVSLTAKPIKMRDSVVYVQDTKSDVYDLSYSFETDSYGGERLTILVPHIIENKTITQWAFQPGPEPIVWCVMSDGSLKSMTYDKQNRVFAWSEHEFATGSDGRATLFEAVSVIPEDDTWKAYFQVKIYDGAPGWRKWIVRAWNRDFTIVNDCKFLDGYKELYNPEVAITNIQEEASSNAIQVTASTTGLSEDDAIEIDEVVGATELNLKKYRAAASTATDFYLVKDQVMGTWGGSISMGLECIVTHLTFAQGGFDTSDGLTACYFAGWGIAAIDDKWFLCTEQTTATFKITNWDGTLLVSGSASSTAGTLKIAKIEDKADVSAYISDGVFRKLTQTWTATISGDYSLNQLDGMTVNALVDGDVEEGISVSGGSITLSNAAARVLVGLPYTSRIQTLPLNTPQAELNGRIRSINKLTCRVYRSRGLEFGQTLTNLVEPDSRSTEAWDEAAAYYDGELSLTLKPYADEKGQVYIQQSKPLPMTVQNIGLNFDLGEE